MDIDRIYNEDCLATLKRMPDGMVDLVITSPPYNMRTRVRNGEYTVREKAGTFATKYSYFDDALSIDEYYTFHKAVLGELLRVSKCICYNYQLVTGSKEAFFKLVGDYGNYIKDIIIWEKKGQPAMHANILNACWEFILILEADGKKGRSITNARFGRGLQNNILKDFAGPEGHKDHSAMFPVDLVRKLLLLFSDEGNLVYDPFMGGGTTAVGAIKEKRHYIGSEIVPEYVALAERRIKEAQSQLVLF